MLGMRKREITLFTAGSGIGKSTTARQLVYELRQDFPELKFGNIFLEERNEDHGAGVRRSATACRSRSCASTSRS
jgi:ABC-type transporter Mla maintaining outer membrane lipid asymmetry ATPase subunit MlaF